MIACLAIPGFELRAALRERPRLALGPAALAPEPGSEPLLGPVTAAAATAGVEPGMRLGEALATCPSLQLVDRDPATAEEAVSYTQKRAHQTHANLVFRLVL
jgi:protein ImuB